MTLHFAFLDTFTAYLCKWIMQGSFEKIQEKSMVESLPSSYLETARNHALDGCYVLGLSHKSASFSPITFSLFVSPTKCL